MPAETFSLSRLFYWYTYVMQAALFYGAIFSFVLGIGVQTVASLSLSLVVWVLVLGFILALVWRRNTLSTQASFVLLGSVALVALSLGLLRTEIASWQFGNSPLADQVGKEITFSGVVMSEPDYRERTVMLYVENESDRVLVTTDRLEEVSYGDKVLVIGRLDAPANFMTDLGREFNYLGYLKAKGVEYRLSFATVSVEEVGYGNWLIARLLSSKQGFINQMQNVVTEPAAGLGSGLLLGVKSALGQDIEEDFRRTGIIHIVVLSGYNVMLVVSFILLVLSFVLPLRLRVWSGLAAIVSFALLVGLSATVVRASIMAGLVLLAHHLGRRYHVMRALFLAGAVMLLVNPYLLLYDIGFQLSFMATLGLVLAIPYFESTMIASDKKLGLKDFFIATVVTQIAVLPLLLYHIGEVSLVAVVVNLLVLPVVPVSMLLTFMAGTVGFLSTALSEVVGYLATLSLNYILWVAKAFAELPFATLIVTKFSVVTVFFMYVSYVLLWLWKQRLGLKNELVDWEIIEEDALIIKQKPLPNSERSKSKVPVFFR